VLTGVAALAWFGIGFAPWLAGGARAPRGERSDVEVFDRMPLPLSTAHLAALVVCAAVGGVLAGLVGFLADRPGLAALFTFGGVVVAVVATTSVSRRLLVEAAPADAFAADPRVLSWLSLVVAASALAGWLLGALGTCGRLGRALALAVLAGLSQSWLGLLAASTGLDVLMWQGAFWASALLVAMSFIVAGATPWPRMLWWPVCAAVAYGLGAPAAALANLRIRAGGSPRLGDLAGQFWDVTKSAADPSVRPFLPWAAAVVVAVVLTAFLEFTSRDRSI
jgi:hypothetical protein